MTESVTRSAEQGAASSHAEFVRRWKALSAEKQQYLRCALLESGPKNLPVVPRSPQAHSLPLSSGQRRLWFLDQMAPGSPFYNMTACVPLGSAPDCAVLERSLSEIVRRHEALRTTFRSDAGEPEQIVHPASPVAVRVIELHTLAAGERESRAIQLASEEAQKPFDLTSGPLIRASLLRLAQDESWLLVTMHHIVSDGWSMSLFFFELGTLCEAYSQGLPSPLPELPVQYADYALWQQAWMTSTPLERELGYWRAKLANAAALELPTDRARPPVATFAGATFSWSLPERLHTHARRVARVHGATPFMVYLTAFKLLLARYTGRSDIVLGCPSASRGRPEIETLIGFFVNTLVLRTDLSGDLSFKEALERVKTTTLEAFEHDDVPFERLVEEIQPDRDPSRNPLFQISFQMYAVDNADQEGQELRAERGTAVFDLAFNLFGDERCTRGVVEYSTDLFEESTIARLIGHYTTLLDRALLDPELPASCLPMLTACERDQLLIAWNSTRTQKCKAPLAAHVLRLAEDQPAALAVHDGEVSLTYGELARRARRLAAELVRHGVGRGERVALCLPRGADLVIAELATLCAGAAFVPIDHRAPQERMARILADSRPRAVLTRSADLKRFGDSAVTVAVDRRNFPDSIEPVPLGPDDIAYVIYTSGSTGTPKGVEVPQRGLVNLLTWHQQTYGVTGADRAAVLAAPDFDASVWEIWSALWAGASLHIVDNTTRAVPSLLWQWIAQHEISTAFAPTPLAEALLAEALPSNLRLRVLLTGGDRMRRAPHTRLPFRLFNNYGPTEYSVVATFCEVAAGGDGPPPIGRPISNTELYVLDRHANLQPIGVPGELYIGGAGLARGYLNRPELTAESFIENPVRPGMRCYRTRDLVRWRPDGQLEFLGRIDDQIQLRGYRIERGEVEAALLAHPGVTQCVVQATATGQSDTMLVAWVAGSVTEPQLRLHLRHRLPAYMHPAAFVLLAELPLTANGKIDLAALPRPEQLRTRETRPPRDAIERDLAAIWSDLLRVDGVGLDDNFFALGGHSLLAARLVSRIRKQLQIELPVPAVFQAPTLERLAECVRDAQHVSAMAAIVPRSRDLLPDDVHGLSDDEVDALLRGLLVERDGQG